MPAKGRWVGASIGFMQAPEGVPNGLGLTPAAVSRNVAMLERNLGVRLFQRSTRSLVLTETGEAFLASIGGTLAPAHMVAVASPAYLRQHKAPRQPADLGAHSGIVMRSLATGRLRTWTLRHARGDEAAAPLRPAVVVNDPAAVMKAARLGLGIGLLAMPDVLPALEAGELVRVLPRWWADAGAISLY